jgi:hypothetical protein
MKLFAVVDAWLWRGALISLGGVVIALVGVVLLRKQVLTFNVRHRIKLYQSFDREFANEDKIVREQKIIAWMFFILGVVVLLIGIVVLVRRGF